MLSRLSGGGEGDEATSGEQNAKRSQRAGRLKINSTRQENDVREPSVFYEVLGGRDRNKGASAISASSKRVESDGSQGPIAEGQERVPGM